MTRQRRDRCARTLIASFGNGVVIDGLEFPFYLAEAPRVDVGGIDQLTVVHLPVIVDGVVVLDLEQSRRVIDGGLYGGLGDVGAWARQFVRDAFEAAFPWLDLPEAS